MSQNVIILRFTPRVEVLFDISLTLGGTMLQKHQRLIHRHKIGKHVLHMASVAKYRLRKQINAQHSQVCKKNKNIKVLLFAFLRVMV